MFQFDRLVDQVIGQEAGSVVIRKAAEQRRHMLMIGDLVQEVDARSLDDRLVATRCSRGCSRLSERGR